MCSRAKAGASAGLVVGGSAVLPEALLPLQWLLGTWRGSGRGFYPTIQEFNYGEEVRFWIVGGKPFIAYAQRTWTPSAAKAPMHVETGYLRPQPHNRVELLVCDPTGVAQVYEGVVDPERHTLEVATTHVGLTSSAKEVKQLRRVYRLLTGSTEEGSSNAPRLHYEVDMAAVGQPMQQHLDGDLEKVPDPALLDISPAELKERFDDYTVIDVREKDEYEKGHVEGAINLPLGQLITKAANNLEQLVAQLPRHQVVVYCRQGYRGALAQQEMRTFEVPRTVLNLKGGWEAWHGHQ